MICDWERESATADFMNHSFDWEDVWLRPCGWFSPVQSQTPRRGFGTTGGSVVPHYGRGWRAPGEDAANGCDQYGRRPPESSGKGDRKKSCLTSAAPPAATALQLPAPSWSSSGPGCLVLTLKKKSLFSLNLHPSGSSNVQRYCCRSTRVN